MKTTILSLILITLFTVVNAQNESSAIASSAAPKVLFADNYLLATLEKVMKTAGIEVLNTQPTYLEIYLGKELKVKTFIDVDTEKNYLLLNGNAALVDGANAAQAYQLVSEMNLGTNFIRAAYSPEKNKIYFTYYYWIKDGFTEKSFISALEMYRLTYMYAFTFDKNNLLK
jgi:hypothetical protein